MRTDMAKVVTESPRRGHANKSQKHGGRLNRHEIDRESGDEGVLSGGLIAWSRRRNKDCKSFSDLLGPLRGYLRKQVGRPWDHVYSELSQTLDKRSLSGLHIWDHVKMEVEQHAVVIGRQIYVKPRYGSMYARVSGLYVHPVSRLLCYSTERRFPRYVAPVDPNVITINPTTQFRRLNGVWFMVTRKQEECRVRHMVEGSVVVDTYTQWVEVKKQLGKKELKHWKLTTARS